MTFRRPILLLLAAAALHAQSSGGPWGGELRFCLHSEPRNLHPALADDDTSTLIAIVTCFPFLAAAALHAQSTGGPWGGELRFCLHSEPRNLHPALADDDTSTLIAIVTCFPFLAAADEYPV